MRTLVLLIVMFTVHRLLVQVYPPYRERVRSFDQKMNWVTIILVTYLVFNFIYVIFFR
ncbi:MAG: hypothetical protein ETSY1_07575 [Candidatus Entotheonella factor]|uniref:Uncharacterized protein n=1 Tax=Entotheonella factor TaxID=1429438 RepID=W4LVL9_ENTF1|nr:hypothetical protein [Candidatus Entotheonella palauensis]ETX01417.1 MAG: hypothetical protein ETSY1_07575 [Candidatus Entotheonella factor]